MTKRKMHASRGYFVKDWMYFVKDWMPNIYANAYSRLCDWEGREIDMLHTTARRNRVTCKRCLKILERTK